MSGYTYMVSGHIKSGGHAVPHGYVLEEAAAWRHVDTYVSNGALTRITNEAAKGLPRYPDDVPPEDTEVEPTEPVEAVEPEPEVTVAPEDEELSQEQYNALNVDEVESLLNDGVLSVDEVDEFEESRPGGSRKGVLALIYEEDGEDDDTGE